MKTSANRETPTDNTRYSLILLVALASVLPLYVAGPFLSIFSVIDAGSLTGAWGSAAFRGALVTSLASATVSIGICAVFGIPLGYLMARYSFPGKTLVRALIILPLAVPPVVGGALLLALFGPYAPVGRLADLLGLQLAGSFWGIMIAQVFVSSPFVILTAAASIESVDKGFEHASMVLGRGVLQTLLRVTLPMARRGILAGLLLAWVRALGEFGATVMMAYNPHTISVQIWEDNAVGGLRQALPEVAFVIALVVLLLAAITLIGRREGLPRIGKALGV